MYKHMQCYPKLYLLVVVIIHMYADVHQANSNELSRLIQWVLQVVRANSMDGNIKNLKKITQDIVILMYDD